MSLSWDQRAQNAEAISLTSGTSWTDVATKTVWVDENYKLWIVASWVATAAVSAGDFRITIDGAEVRIAPAPVGAVSGFLQHWMPCSASTNYVVKLQCRRGGVALTTLDIAAGDGQLSLLQTSA